MNRRGFLELGAVLAAIPVLRAIPPNLPEPVKEIEPKPREFKVEELEKTSIIVDHSKKFINITENVQILIKDSSNDVIIKGEGITEKNEIVQFHLKFNTENLNERKFTINNKKFNCISIIQTSSCRDIVSINEDYRSFQPISPPKVQIYYTEL